MGTLHHDEIGLIWADTAVSARNLVRGTFNDHLENPLAISASEMIDRVEGANRRLARHRAQAEWKDAELAHELESARTALGAQLEAVKLYAETGKTDPRLTPACDQSVQAEINISRSAALKAAAPEIDAFKQVAKATAWEFSTKRVSGSSVVITYKMPVSDLAAKPSLLNEGDLRRNIRVAMDRLRSPSFDRRSIAVVAAAMIEEALCLGPKETTLRPARWYPSNAGPSEHEESTRSMATLSLMRHQPLPLSLAPTGQFGSLLPSWPVDLKVDAEAGKRWRRWRAELLAAQRKQDSITSIRLINAGPDPPT